jgi:hypothetical protein
MSRYVELATGLMIGLLIGFTMHPSSATAQSYFIRWGKEEVTPIVIVEPSFGQFIPKGGSALQASWRKDEVTPMCLVKTAIGGFVPVEGNPIGNSWTKDEVKPYSLVVPVIGGFAPAR